MPDSDYMQKLSPKDFDSEPIKPKVKPKLAIKPIQLVCDRCGAALMYNRSESEIQVFLRVSPCFVLTLKHGGNNA